MSEVSEMISREEAQKGLDSLLAFQKARRETKFGSCTATASFPNPYDSLKTIIVLYDRIAALESRLGDGICPKHPLAYCKFDSQAGLVCDRCEADAVIVALEDMFRDDNPEAVTALGANILRGLSPERIDNLCKMLSGRYCQMGAERADWESGNTIPRSRYDAADLQWEETKAELDRVRRVAAEEIKRLEAENEALSFVVQKFREQRLEKVDELIETVRNA